MADTNSGATSFSHTGLDAAQSVVDYCLVLPQMAAFHPLLTIGEYRLSLSNHQPLVVLLHLSPLLQVPLQGSPPPWEFVQWELGAHTAWTQHLSQWPVVAEITTALTTTIPNEEYAALETLLLC